MTEKLPWMPFYGSDFYESENVRLMDFAEQSVYLRMLWRQWRFDSLPADTGEIEKVIEVSGVTPRVLEMFPVGRDGRRRNPRLQHLAQEQLAIQEVRVRAGRLGGKAKAKGKQTPSKTVAKVKQKVSYPEPEPDKEKTTWLTPFAEIWERRCGNPPFGKLASVLAPLVKSHGAPEVIARWSRYLDGTEPKFCSPHRFAETYAAWVEPDTKEMTDEFGAMRKWRKTGPDQWEIVA